MIETGRMRNPPKTGLTAATPMPPPPKTPVKEPEGGVIIAPDYPVRPDGSAGGGVSAKRGTKQRKGSLTGLPFSCRPRVQRLVTDSNCR